MRNEVDINENMISWAITRAGYDLHEFAQKLPRVNDWIDGSKKPTVKQLEKFAKKVYLPFGYFFLKEPPREKLPIPYFRSSGNYSANVSVNVYDTIQLMLQRQDWLKIIYNFRLPIKINHERTTKIAPVTRNASFSVLRSEIQN